MARGKKKESALTPEEKLVQALVPVEEQPYKVPENWCWVHLDAVLTEIKNGTTIKQDKSGEGYSVTRIESLQNQTIDFGRLGNIVDASAIKETDWYQEGDIALSHINSAEHVGKTALITSDMLPLVHGMNLLRLRFNEACLPVFYQYYSQSFQYKSEILDRINMAVNQVSINQKQLGSMEFPLPPIKEQQRIVDRIEYLFAKLDEAKEKAQSVLDSFETRKAAILHKAFTGELTAKWRNIHDDQIGDIDMTPLDKAYDDYDTPHNLPSSWKWVKFNDCCTFVGSGVTPKGGKEVYQTTGVPFIRSQNVLKGELDLSDVAYIPVETDAMMKRTRILGGETLFNITGASIGRACFVPFTQNIGNVNQHVCILRYKNYVAPELPQFWLNSPAVQDFVVGNQIGQTRQALNFKQIRGMYYPLAPKGEQNEIVRILDSLFAKEQQAKEAAEAVLEKIDLLKKSILARASRGELGTNDPGEESALELLKTIL